MTDAELSEFRRTCDEKHLADRGRIDSQEETIRSIFEILRKLQNRPSWAVTIVITSLTSACGMLILWIITHGK